MELIVIDNHESLESCPNTTIDRLPDCDQVGVEGVLLDHEETDGFLKASSPSHSSGRSRTRTKMADRADDLQTTVDALRTLLPPSQLNLIVFFFKCLN